MKAIQRPQRWDEPFDPNMDEPKVDRVLSIAPFSEMDHDDFPAKMPLQDILLNDTRVLSCQRGDIIVREGDYGNSAYFILSGTVRVEIEPEEFLPARALGRREPKRKNFFEAIAQWWKNPRGTEVRPASYYTEDAQVASRQDVSGNVQIYLQDVPAIIEKYKTVRRHAGEFFGETAALGRTPRTATIFADGDTELLEIRWQGLRDIMRRNKKLKEHIDQIYRERNMLSHLMESPLFRHLHHSGAPEGCECEKCRAIHEILASTALETYGEFDWHTSFEALVEKRGASRLDQEPVIAQEGHYHNGLIMIRFGFARVSKRLGHGHRTASYLGPGRYYGFDEIVHNWRNKTNIPLQHSLRAIGYSAVLLVPTALIEKYVLGSDRENPIVPANLLPPPIPHQEAHDIKNDKAEVAEKIGDDMLEFLVEKRFINGTAAMIIDLDRCTRCDECVHACAGTHDNNPRFIRHGPKLDHHMVTNACMHCADPVCMIGCPTGAIHRDLFQGQVVINDATCIGCSACANSCPYDNIRMAAIRDQNDNFILDQRTNTPIFKATKCDLCVDQLGGPACARACPHDALIRIDINKNFETLANWVTR